MKDECKMTKKPTQHRYDQLQRTPSVNSMPAVMRVLGLVAGIFASSLFAGTLATPAIAQEEEPAEEAAPEPVSFYRQVRPMLQRHCSGCHQPAKKPLSPLSQTHYHHLFHELLNQL